MTTNQSSIPQSIKKDELKLVTNEPKTIQHIKNNTQLETTTRNVKTTVQEAEINTVDEQDKKQTNLSLLQQQIFSENIKIKTEEMQPP